MTETATKPAGKSRDLEFEIDGRKAFAVKTSNQHLLAAQEISDNIDDYSVEMDKLDKQIADEQDLDARRELRTERRRFLGLQLDLNVEALSLLVEDDQGESFSHDLLSELPVSDQGDLVEKAQTILGIEAKADPTPATEPASI